jgi:hypothetical protein
MKKLCFSILISFVASILMVATAIAQTEQLTLRMSRDWGYGGFNGDIQGLFSMKVTGPADLAKVTFYIDQTAIGEVSQAPFNLQFTTDDYPLGVHELYAVGISSSGTEYRSNVLKAEFVPATEGGKMVLPILAVLLGAVLLSAVVPIVMSRKRKPLPFGAERNYGFAGGTICQRCNRPYPLSMFNPNMVVGKLAACPYCGKVGIMRAYPIDVLRAAEQAEANLGKGPTIEESEEDKLKKNLDDSKYQGF